MASISSLGIGSGLDLSGLLDQLESAERQKLTPIVAQQNKQQAKISSFGLLDSALDQLNSAVAKLASPDLFSTVKASSSGDAATVTADAEALPGTFQVEVQQLARGYSIATAGVADREADLGAGVITLTLASGDTADIDIDADNSSLEDIRDAINAADAGVSASLVNDGSGSPWRLVLASSETGSEAAIAAVDFGALAGSLSLDAGTEVAARNAELSVNGIAIQSQSNSVADAIQGVTLNLAETGSLELELERDSEKASNAVQGFVNSYNALQKTIGSLSSYNSDTGSAGMLLGNNTLRSIETRLRDGMSTVENSGALGMLSDIGVSLQLDGTLSLDSDRLDEVVAAQPGDLAAFFTGDGENGFANRLADLIDPMVQDGGLIDSATDALDDSIDALGLRYERMEQSIAATVSRYRSQFSQLDSLIATMNSTSSYLTQQFDMMNAQLGRK
ncbi:flagellar filament capping protein FliD [Parahaliea aestuarii]|uniref:Flagellar hook-associated protein 2 n=1 Tax=Parahaliea aestuarii TaxID=1852021 RepID=A0A5C9A503_9GAMM|nr:flagellar filament capping protein FliD [Parahaliea aestuarii]TXS95149.1 flagellar hook protein [Parahaliea aestuarii]